jgi:hypothetical protein
MNMKTISSVLAVLLLGVLPAWALINVNFTPADLIRGAQQVSVVKLLSVKDKVVAAEVVETIRGKAPTDPKLNLNLDPDGQLSADALNAALPATALLVLAAPENLDLTKDRASDGRWWRDPRRPAETGPATAARMESVRPTAGRPGASTEGTYPPG